MRSNQVNKSNNNTILNSKLLSYSYFEKKGKHLIAFPKLTINLHYLFKTMQERDSFLWRFELQIRIGNVLEKSDPKRPVLIKHSIFEV